MQEAPDTEKSIWARVFIVLAQLLATIAVFLLGIFLTENRSAWLIAGLTVVVAAISSTVIALLVSWHFMRRTEALVRSIESSVTTQLADIAHAAQIRAEGRDGVTQEALSKYESRLDVKTIWIVGANFDTEVAKDAPFLSVVKNNIHTRGVKYVYIAPEEAKLHANFKRLRAELGLVEDDLRLITLHLTNEQWRKLPYPSGNFVIYDPIRAGHAPEGYCWDPGGDGKSFIRLRRDVTPEWVGKIQEVCPELNYEYDDHVPEETT